MVTKRVCLDLFSGLGGFSAAFADSDRWDVTTVDIEPAFDPDICADVMDLRPADLPDVDVVLVGFPCYDLSLACMADKWDSDPTRFPRYVPKTMPAARTIGLLYHTLWLVWRLSPAYWILENPRLGMLGKIIGPPAGAVTYCQYGTDYQKPTGLWGRHPPMAYRSCNTGDECHEYNTDGDHGGLGNCDVMGKDPAERAKVPYELSAAIRDACERAFEHPPPEQATLVEVSNDAEG